MCQVLSSVTAQYYKFVAAGRDTEENRLPVLEQLVKDLPKAHYHTLGFLIHHLRKVEEHSKQNKVSIFKFVGVCECVCLSACVCE